MQKQEKSVFRVVLNFVNEQSNLNPHEICAQTSLPRTLVPSPVPHHKGVLKGKQSRGRKTGNCLFLPVLQVTFPNLKTHLR